MSASGLECGGNYNTFGFAVCEKSRNFVAQTQMQETENYPDGNCLGNTLDATPLAGCGDPKLLSERNGDEAQEPCRWHVFRVTYGRSQQVGEAMDGLGFETFVPLMQKVYVSAGRRVRRMVPAIPNILFVRAAESDIKKFKAETNLPVRYFMDRATGKPLLVPDRQMADFISIARMAEGEDVVYLDPRLAAMAKGTRVRVTGGLFQGAEGKFLRVRGDRRLVVTIPGVAAVATAFIHPSLVEPIIEKS